MTNEPTHKANLLSAMSGGFWKPLGILLGVLIVVVLLVGSALYVWARTYEDIVLPNVSVGDISLEGLDYDQARSVVQTQIDEILGQGVQVALNETQKTLPLVTLVGEDLVEEVEFDLEGLVQELASMHGDSTLQEVLVVAKSLFVPTNLEISATLQEDDLVDLVRELFPDTETLANEPSFSFSFSEYGWEVESVEGTSGVEFTMDDLLSELKRHLTQLRLEVIELDLSDRVPLISLADAQAQEEQALAAILEAPYRTEFDDSGGFASWELTREDLEKMIEPGTEGQIVLDEDLFEEWVLPISAALNIDAQNARLEIEDGRVTDFVASADGRSVDEQALFDDLTLAVQQAQDETIEITVLIDEPTTAIGDVNNLGITEILGTGTSSYRGSPYNRRLNIQNGVDLLNGRLIAPGETFSLLEALSPFTLENGYFPELVIKGDKIEPEIGGGLCQIGTTTFRATMNAGLEVTERRNHSLVVSYYNDQTNGLPGTDATIYEPAPDYKLTNNTENYILFQAENLTDTQDLRFTFWGTSDGRQGSYTAPVVTRWIPVGDDQMIETEDLEPGEEECQEAHVGADASFTYTVVRPSGEIDETIFESHYRPLQKICLVGIDPEAEDNGETSEETKNPEQETQDIE